MNRKLPIINQRLRDDRSGQVVFVAHCVLNQNVRVQSGAFQKGGLDPIIDDLQRRGIGIVQMRCPEQLAWGGVQRGLLWAPAVGTAGSAFYRLRRLTLPLFQRYSRLRMRQAARKVVAEIADLRDAGQRVLGIIGIGGSPSCGVYRTLDLRRAFEYLAHLEPRELERGAMIQHAFRGCIAEGRGLFIDEIVRCLQRRRVSVPLFEHDIISEIEGRVRAIPV